MAATIADDCQLAAGEARAMPVPLLIAVKSSGRSLRTGPLNLTEPSINRGRPEAAEAAGERPSGPAEAAEAAVPGPERMPRGTREPRSRPAPPSASDYGEPFFHCWTSVFSTVERIVLYDNHKVIDSNVTTPGFPGSPVMAKSRVGRNALPPRGALDANPNPRVDKSRGSFYSCLKKRRSAGHNRSRKVVACRFCSISDRNRKRAPSFPPAAAPIVSKSRFR